MSATNDPSTPVIVEPSTAKPQITLPIWLKVVLSILLILFIFCTVVLIPYLIPDFAYARGGDGFWWGVGYAVCLGFFGLLCLVVLELFFGVLSVQGDIVGLSCAAATLAVLVSSVTFMNQYEQIQVPDKDDHQQTVVVTEAWLQKVGLERLKKILAERNPPEASPK